MRWGGEHPRRMEQQEQGLGWEEGESTWCVPEAQGRPVSLECAKRWILERSTGSIKESCTVADPARACPPASDLYRKWKEERGGSRALITQEVLESFLEWSKLSLLSLPRGVAEQQGSFSESSPL